MYQPLIWYSSVLIYCISKTVIFRPLSFPSPQLAKTEVKNIPLGQFSCFFIIWKYDGPLILSTDPKKRGFYLEKTQTWLFKKCCFGYHNIFLSHLSYISHKTLPKLTHDTSLTALRTDIRNFHNLLYIFWYFMNISLDLDIIEMNISVLQPK